MSEADNPKDRVLQKQQATAHRVAPGRRRLLTGGLAASPVLMTLVSRPVLGAVQCVTPSAFYSGNASTAGIGVICEGHTADYWLNTSSWPPPYTPDTPFNNVFGPNPVYACLTLQDVLSPPDSVALDPPPTPTHGHKHNRDRSHSGLHGQGAHDGETSDQGSSEHNAPHLGSMHSGSSHLSHNQKHNHHRPPRYRLTKALPTRLHKIRWPATTAAIRPPTPYRPPGRPPRVAGISMGATTLDAATTRPTIWPATSWRRCSTPTPDTRRG
jgi:hypothetical protein